MPNHGSGMRFLSPRSNFQTKLMGKPFSATPPPPNPNSMLFFNLLNIILHHIRHVFHIMYLSTSQLNYLPLKTVSCYFTLSAWKGLEPPYTDDTVIWLKFWMSFCPAQLFCGLENQSCLPWEAAPPKQESVLLWDEPHPPLVWHTNLYLRLSSFLPYSAGPPVSSGTSSWDAMCEFPAYGLGIVFLFVLSLFSTHLLLSEVTPPHSHHVPE